MTIIVTGGHGYIGWPTALRIATWTDELVVIADDQSKDVWSTEVGGINLRAVQPHRLQLAWNVLGTENLYGTHTDLTDRAAVDTLLGVHEPHTVVHTAAQPSAPFAGINGETARRTQTNNLTSTLNLLWGLHDAGLEDTHVIETTTTGVYGAPDFPIPEGPTVVTDAHGDSIDSDVLPFPNLGGSWYHVTKGFDAANLRRAHDEFGLPISDVRTAITYGADSSETEGVQDLGTRLDIDYYFGTVVHRFCAQAVAGYPITVYGKGEQRKPFVALEDAVEGLARLAIRQQQGRVDGHTVYNQVTRAIPIVELAETVVDVATDAGFDTELTHIENPRDEDEEHQMEIDNDRYLEVIDGQSVTLQEGVEQLVDVMAEHEDGIKTATDRFLPDSLQD